MKRSVLHLRPSVSRLGQKGVTMFVTVILVLILSVVALAVFQQSSFDEKSARGQYDRQLASQAAEMAMRDAELDLACMQMPALNSANSNPIACTAGATLARQPSQAGAPPRTCRELCGLPGGAKKTKLIGFENPPSSAGNAGRWASRTAAPAVAASGGQAGSAATSADSPVATRSNWSDSSGNLASVALGQFTGTSDLALVTRQPRYMIEGFNISQTAEAGSVTETIYRITAKGWGRNANTEITLQQIYKP